MLDSMGKPLQRRRCHDSVGWEGNQMTTSVAPTSIGAKHTRYSVLWFGESSESSANEMFAIEEWAHTAVPRSGCCHEPRGGAWPGREDRGREQQTDD